ncbi:S8 family serine peptidase [Actinacidiphila bryophytorum]|uniref:S8 family serine peptidase n=1 Tax=Actinacidiphila bryophytorum TaxID=1436133 RepID=UPI002176A359|nr:S8 family serine peptidase [Actinacidiphila bryophytorum]UWE10319.1 S8 family serine peptidase [Actinacidiphila bryophytorum]
MAATTVISLSAVVPSASADEISGTVARVPANQLSQGAKHPVIVVLRNQHKDVPANSANMSRRTSLVRSEQQSLIAQAKQAGATKVHQFTAVNGFSATVTDAERDYLEQDPGVAAVVPDRAIRPARQEKTEPVTPKSAASAKAATAIGSGVCPADPTAPLLEPEALAVTNTAFSDASKPQAQNLATGKGVKVAFLADTIDPDNPEFIRADGSKVITDFQDFTPEGIGAPGSSREAFGDAASIAAQGRQTYDLSEAVSPLAPLPKGCTIRFRGVAPDASLLALKVGDARGVFATSAVVQGIDYAIKSPVDVINESFGGLPVPDDNTDPISLANDAAVAAGITVVASSGDGGEGNTVVSPSSDPLVISAAASTTLRLDAQSAFGPMPGWNGSWHNNNVASVGSSGVTENGRVADLMAPGDSGWAPCTPDPTRFFGCLNVQGKPSPVIQFGGTSQSAPLVAGGAALVIEAYAQTHNGARPSPALVKQILTSTATDEDHPSQMQGTGLLNTYAAVRAAQSVHDDKGSPAPQGNQLLVKATQLSATGQPGTATTLALPVTNLGGVAQTVTAQQRTLSAPDTDMRGAVALDATASGPTWVDGFGATRRYVAKTFTVPAGADRLDTSINYTLDSGFVVRLALLDPSGAIAGWSFPAALSGFAHIDVHDPAAGTWTAMMYASQSPAGYKDDVGFEFSTSHFVTSGKVSPASLTLAPGQSGTFQVTADTPAQAGDSSAAVVLDSANGPQVAVPLTLRSLVPLQNGRGSFSGVLTGGRGAALAQGNTFRFDVPAGQKDVGVSLSLRGDPDETVFGYLISPDGQILGKSTNVTADASGNPTGFADSLQTFHRDPAPGRWRFVAFFLDPLSGTTTQQPFSGQVTLNTVDISATGLPNSGSTTLPAGVPTTVTLSVHNTGVGVGSYSVDARTTGAEDLPLTAQSPATNLPLNPSVLTSYLVPPETTQLTGKVTGTIPATADLVQIEGGAEVLGRPDAGNVALASLSAPEVTPGQWLVAADATGPFTTPAAGTATLGLVAHTQAFDPSVTSSTGDPWLAAVSTAPAAVSPLSLNAGSTGTITVTITPSAPKGTVVSGRLYVHELNPVAGTGNELIALPYTYTVG